MSMFENDQYRWRETYFVLFDSANRPSLEDVQQALLNVDPHYMLTNLNADEDGRFESLTVLAADDFAALDICYLGGKEVVEQAAEWADEMIASCCQEDEKQRLKDLGRRDGRFDVLHFEQIAEGESDGDDEMLDPGALLLVLDVLAELTDGVSLDPQAGTLL